MFGKAVIGLGGLTSGVIVGLAVVVALAVFGGTWRPPVPTPVPQAPARAEKPAPAFVPPTVTARPTATPPPTPAATPAPTAAPRPTATVAPSAVRVNSLAELSRLAPELRGQRAQVAVGEQELTDRTAEYLRDQGVPASDLRVRIHPGQLVLTGRLQQGLFGLGFTVTGRPVVVDRGLKLAVDSVDPPLVSQFSSVAPGQTIDLPLDFDAEQAEASEGQLLVTGNGR